MQCKCVPFILTKIAESHELFDRNARSRSCAFEKLPNLIGNPTLNNGHSLLDLVLKPADIASSRPPSSLLRSMAAESAGILSDSLQCQLLNFALFMCYAMV